MNRGSVEHMNRARARKPASGGKLYQKARKSLARRNEPAKGSWDRLLTQTRFAWKSSSRDTMLGYERAVFPERFEEFI